MFIDFTITNLKKKLIDPLKMLQTMNHNIIGKILFSCMSFYYYFYFFFFSAIYFILFRTYVNFLHAQCYKPGICDIGNALYNVPKKIKYY